MEGYTYVETLVTPLGTYIIKGSSYSNCTATIKTAHGEREVDELGGRMTRKSALWHYETICIAQRDKLNENNRSNKLNRGHK